jgi:hypothetical protein
MANPARRNAASPSPNGKGTDYDRLVRQVADRVWQLWREELRRARQRPKAGR